MSLSKVFEGQYDRVFRTEAFRALQDLCRGLQLHPEVANVQPRSLTVKAGKIDGLPTDLFFSFDFVPGEGKPEAQFAPTVSGGKGLIKMTIYGDVNAPDFDPLTVVSENPEFIRDAFVHEYVHYMDWKRMGHQSWSEMNKRQKSRKEEYPTEQGQLRSYYQEPIEQNAFFQQAAESFSSAMTPERAEKLGIDAFYRLFVKHLQNSVGSIDVYRERQIPNLKKRVAQLYNDIIGSG